MKKIMFGLIVVAMVLNFSGCKTTKEMEQIEESVNKTTMSIINDSINFYTFINCIGKDKKVFQDLLSENRIEDKKNVILFGKEAELHIETEENRIIFEKIIIKDKDIESLQSAVSEQLGIDPKKENNRVFWQHDNCIILLKKGDKVTYIGVKEMK